MKGQRKIPFFNYPALFQAKEKEYMDVVRDVLRRGAYILQQELLDFERNLAQFVGAKYAFGVADGTNALILALRAADVGPGDEVIVPSHTYVASAAAIHYVGAKPVLVECGKDHLIDPEDVQRAVSSATKAVMPVQLNGRTANMDELSELASADGLDIIEDAAQALGSRFKDRCAGTFGRAGTFSFYPAKLLGCFGDGGAVVTNDDAIAEQLSLLRDHGRNADGEVVAWGTNSRLDNLQAAILDFKLKTYVQDIERRRAIAELYQERLGDLDTVVLPPAPSESSNHFDVYQNYEIEADERDRLQTRLREQGVGTIVQFGGRAVHQYPLGFEGVRLPRTERLYERALLLPMHVALTNDDVEYICDAVRSFYK